MFERSNYRVLPEKLALNGESASYLVPIKQLNRLADRLYNQSGAAVADFNFSVDENGNKIAQGKLSVDLEVVCQRCMSPFVFPLQCNFALAFVTSEAEADALPDHLEPVILTDGYADIKDVIEDELILGVPILFRHSEDECVIKLAANLAEDTSELPADSVVGGKRKSLAGLGDLMKKNFVKSGEDHGSSKKS